jgi:hypothetical protein
MKFCNKCEEIKELRYFYSRTDKYGRVRYGYTCKSCLGVKNPERITKQKTIEVKPTKKEIKSFVKEMSDKGGYFDFVDSLRLIDLFTRQNGIVFTNFSIEDELMYMWEELKSGKN